MPPEKPLETALQNTESVISPQHAVVTIQTREGKERQVDLRHPLDHLHEEDLTKVLQAIFKDPGIEGYERLMLTNAVWRQQRRLRERMSKQPPQLSEENAEGYWQTYFEVIPQHVIAHLNALRTYVRNRDALRQGSGGFQLRYELKETPEVQLWEKSAEQHLAALSQVLNTRVRLGHFGALIIMLREAKTDEERKSLSEALTNARAEILKLPTTITLQTPASRKNPARLPSGGRATDTEVILPVHSLATADRDPKVFQALGQTSMQLEAEIRWIMSFEDGVPGAPKPPQNTAEQVLRDLKREGLRLIETAAGITVVDDRGLPSEHLLIEMWSNALRENVLLEQRLLQQPGNNTIEIQKAREDRARIIAEMIRLEKSYGSRRLHDTKHLLIHHAIGDTFDKPFSGSDQAVTNAEVQQYIQQMADSQIQGFRRHFEIVLGKQKDGKFSGGLMSPGLSARAEDLWNQQGRHQMNALIEQLTALRMAYRDVIRDKTPLFKELPSAVKNQVISSADDKRQEVLKSLRVAMGFPEQYDPLLSEADNEKKGVKLTAAQKELIAKRYESTKTVIEKNRAPLERSATDFSSSLETLEQLRKKPGYSPDEIFGTEPNVEALRKCLPSKRIEGSILGKLDALPEEERKGAAVALYFSLFDQLHEDLNGYFNGTEKYFGELEGVLNIHLDIEREATQAGRKLSAELSTILMVLGGILGTSYVLGGRGAFARLAAGGRIPLGFSTANPIKLSGSLLRQGTKRMANGPFSILDRVWTGGRTALRGDWRGGVKALLWDPAAPSTASAAPRVRPPVVEAPIGASGARAARSAEAAAEAARGGTRLRVGWASLAIGADALAAYSAYQDYQAAQHVIDTSKNKEIVALAKTRQKYAIQDATTMPLAEAAMGAVTLLEGAGATQAINAGLTNPLLLPVAATALTTQYIRNEALRAAETLSLQQRDLLQKSEGELLALLKDTEKDKFNTLVVKYLTGDVDPLNLRSEICRAYFMLTAKLPQDLAKQVEEAKESYEKLRLIQEYAALAVQYLSTVNPALTNVTRDQLREARLHAEVLHRTRRIRGIRKEALMVTIETPVRDEKGNILKDADGNPRMQSKDENLGEYPELSANDKKDRQRMQEIMQVYTQELITKPMLQQIQSIKERPAKSADAKMQQSMDVQRLLIDTLEDDLAYAGGMLRNAEHERYGALQGAAMLYLSNLMREELFREAQTLLGRRNLQSEDWETAISRLRGKLNPAYFTMYTKSAAEGADLMRSVPFVAEKVWEQHLDPSWLKTHLYLQKAENLPQNMGDTKLYTNPQVKLTPESSPTYKSFFYKTPKEQREIRFIHERWCLLDIKGKWNPITGTQSEALLKDLASINDEADRIEAIQKK